MLFDRLKRVLLVLLLLTFTMLSSFEFFIDAELMARIEKQYGPFAKKRFIALGRLMETLKDKDDPTKLERVNEFFNNVKYASDRDIYGVSDYWATPWEFLGKDRGDCEDYVIAKYFVLKSLGVDYKKMYFTYVKSSKFSETHMVLTYFATPTSEPLILDNLNRLIFPASKRSDLTPIYNFNGDVLNRSGEGSNKSHKKWDELMENLKRKKI